MTTWQGDYEVTVCSECLRASCWHFEHPCESAGVAGTKQVRASELRVLGLEHEDHYSREKLLKVCGSVKEVR